MGRQHSVTVCCLAVLCAVLLSAPAVVADDKDKPKEGSVMGLIIEKKDNMMTVKADGETEAIKYYLPEKAEKRMVDAFQKELFTVSRVEVKYKLDGDKRVLTAFRRHIPGNKLTGTITGEVVEIHNMWWIEVKPKDGVVDGFAPGYETKEKAKAIEEQVKQLKKGDIVTIKFTTDFERHRIVTLEKKE